MAHYIYTKEGAVKALGLNEVGKLNYYIKKAKKVGDEPSKIIGGIEYFDIDILKNPTENKIKLFVKKQIKNNAKKSKRLQLQLFE